MITPVKYMLGTRDDPNQPYIEYCGNEKWAVRLYNECMTKTGEWAYEPLPSSRDEDFIEKHRFNSVAEAHSCYESTMGHLSKPLITKDKS